MSQTYLSKERAKTLLVEVVEASPPGSTNPRDPNAMFGLGMCMYDLPEAKGKFQRRCMVGEILHRAGIPLPSSNVGINFLEADYVTRGYMSLDTLEWLGKVQARFDHWTYGKDGGKRRSTTWRQALKTSRKEGLL